MSETLLVATRNAHKLDEIRHAHESGQPALVGTISAAVAPFPLIAWLSSQRAAYSLLAACYAIALVMLGAFAFLRLRERPGFATRAPNPIVPGVRRALRNRPFRILLSSYVVGSVTAAIPASPSPSGTRCPLSVSSDCRLPTVMAKISSRGGSCV